MPRSNTAGKKWTGVVFKLLEHRGEIRRVLDIGPGEGTYSMLGRSAQQEWVGIEVWAPYIRKFGLNDKYDQVVVADVRYVDLGLLGAFDLAFAGDILEHMTKEDAQRVVERLLEQCRFLIISIPIGHYPQGEVDGNPFEAHVKADWCEQEVLDSFAHIRAGAVIDGIGVFVLAKAEVDGVLIDSVARQAGALLSDDKTQCA